jgi:hypothetical protein
MARQDLDRVLTAQAYERQRNVGLPELKMAATSEEEIARMAHDEAYIRRYLVEHEILTIPADSPHWTLRLAPDYVAAFAGFGELDDFTLPSRPSRMEFGGCCRSPRILPISMRRRRRMRVPRACMKACRDISSNCLWLGAIRIRSGATTTIPERTKGSVLTPKR